MKSNSKIFLAPEIRSGLGEDTFWTWFEREAGGEFDLPKKLAAGDVVLHYSTLGKPAFPSQTVSLLWELYPEMTLRLGDSFSAKNRKIKKSFTSRWATCPTHYSRAFYARNTVVLPIGVDTGLFKPAQDRASLRQKHGLNPDEKIAFWYGQEHPMKGPDLRNAWLEENQDWKLITPPRGEILSQKKLAELMQLSDGFLNTSRLVPLYMIEWEAMACGLPFIQAGGVEREANPIEPRKFVMAQGWSRDKALETWTMFLDGCRRELSS